MVEQPSIQELQHQQQQCCQEHIYKNRLQEFTQRASLPLPSYHTVNEQGSQHAPRFKSSVEVDGETYTSSSTFSNRKAAEQDAAKVALEGLSTKIKNCIIKKTTDGGFPPIYEDRVFCKSILNEFATKMKLERPTYKTVKLEGLIPVYVSSLVFDGTEYTGEPSINKKEAEQLAARAVILSILASSGVRTLLSEIVKSKAKLFSAVHERTNAFTDVPPRVPNSGSENFETKDKVSVDAEKANSVIGNLESEGSHAANVIETGVPETLKEQSPVLVREEFKKPLLEISPQAIPHPITSVPTLLAQTLLGGVACGGKSKAKKKSTSKKAKNKVKLSSALHDCSTVYTEVSSLSPNTGNGAGTSETKGKVSEDGLQLQSARGASEDSNQAGNMVGTSVLNTLQEQFPVLVRHEFRKPMSETFPQPMPLPITFVPSVQAQDFLGGLACGEKRKAKKKKRKANKKAKAEIQMQVSNLPPSHVTSCAIGQ